MLTLVGLTVAAGRRVRTYSLGMRQRLGLAGVLLGDPHTVILDEPANGLDPEGIRWIRDVLTHLASQGRTVLVSSHLLSEMALMATDLVVIGQGRLIEQCTVDEFVARWGDHWVKVRSPRSDDLARALAAGGAHVAQAGDSALEIRGATIEDVGELAARHGLVLHELSPQTGSLEDAFLKATAHAQEYRSVPAPAPAATPQPGTPDDRRPAQRMDQAADDPDELGAPGDRRRLPADRQHPHHGAAERTRHRRQGRGRPGLGHVGRSPRCCSG